MAGTAQPPGEAQNLRRTIVSAPTVSADELVARPHLPPSGVTTRRQVAITYRGAFEFQVGRSTTWVDPSRILFADAGQAFADRHVLPGTGHRSVILTPDPAVLDELWGNVAPHFARRSAPCPPKVQMLVHLLRRTSDPLAAEELGIAILESSAGDDSAPAGRDTRCVRRAKAMLHDGADGRLTLTRIASEIGVTPVHLTQSFKRAEGIPLYRYQTRLRLSRALDQLPERADIADLAFELGFSSHSHFTAAFRGELGTTPSRYRSAARRAGGFA